MLSLEAFGCGSQRSPVFLRATACNASRVLSPRRPSVCLSVHTLELYQNYACWDHKIFTVGCTKDYSFMRQNFVPLVEGIRIKRKRQKKYTQKWLQIPTNVEDGKNKKTFVNVE